MRLLIVGFAGSPHIARYLQLLTDTGWEIHLFDSVWRQGTPVHSEIPPSVIQHRPRRSTPPDQDGNPLRRRRPTTRELAADLIDVLQETKPDIVHSHELQHGAALVYFARSRHGLDAPWLVTNWGSDIFWFGRDPRRASLIRLILGSCDYYCAECHRDVALARAFGLRGTVIGVWPVTGGLDLSRIEELQAPGPTSARRAIAVKAANHLSIGCFHNAVTAIKGCLDLIRGWELCAYQVPPGGDAELLELERAGHLRYTKVSSIRAQESTHDEVLAMHGRSRVSLALNRSDGLSTSFLEAVAMGSFPVQSSSSCGRELVQPGKGALFVPATDPEIVTQALRRALSDDQLVDSGARLNSQAAAEHLDRRQIRARVIDAYERIAFDRAAYAC